ncbi:uncharacterized protein Nmlp_2367 [Natronomonas moolapensis 8.8.11]|uniref:Uncharacterized protein n=1 Tax=Natronomonas moolapensis (strain DSM 18674 / CECT 7526 / JCM 14361 / 8.8.11) TaxID=268739 RepID=M1XQU6_NATM8|nr:hypothetical protein [Natronomonas moolapensis]CCQ36535.1 uncharacterized protein Nmlp_2367 [Natronomonas moolapensis 8.8.11]
MRRRAFLGCLAGSAVSLAGCSNGPPERLPQSALSDSDESTPGADGRASAGEATPSAPEATVTTRIDAPQRRRVGLSFRLRIVVENDGEEPQTVTRTVRDLTGGATVGGFSETVPPGGWRAWTSPPVTYGRVPEFGTAAFEVEETGQLLDVRLFESLHPRSSHSYNDGLEVTFEGVRILRAYGHEIDGERRWRTAEDGSRFAFVFLSVAGVRGDDVVRPPPTRAGLPVRAGDAVVRPTRTRYSPDTGAIVPSRYSDDRRGTTPSEDVPAYDATDLRRVAVDGRHPTTTAYGDTDAAPDRTLWLAYTVPAGTPADRVRLLASR